jgi:hypothetical protein
MPTHVDKSAFKHILGMAGVGWIDERVLRSIKIIGIVPLHRLRQKRNPNQQNDP